MKILGIDSSAKSASVAVVLDGTIFSEAYVNAGLTHSRTLAPMTGNALENAGIAPDEIDAFAVAVGPGSFTGVRIGTAFVKGLAQASGKPCIPVSALETIAYPLRSRECIAAAVMDARCGQVYSAVFEFSQGRCERITPDEALLITELAKKLKNRKLPVILIGDGAQMCYNKLADIIPGIILADEQIRYQRASSVALIAYEALSNGAEPVGAGELRPVYLRVPQAERELKNKEEKR
ncbi:MAG: tRNA (adenosine(37)-N6)-threonylcarbamoyltransferase complex dimerization subunit type 1 TsaB [Clostridiales bacterium]|nr:tRNA (adenosine(37)-N6)-threonylcarbamoyltransferase complex dimerization subunit type 1 TsaB [Clostridiales bacterium]